jgi:hypothetical protein
MSQYKPPAKPAPKAAPRHFKAFRPAPMKIKQPVSK